jgi:hypothetical protein
MEPNCYRQPVGNLTELSVEKVFHVKHFSFYVSPFRTYNKTMLQRLEDLAVNRTYEDSP